MDVQSDATVESSTCVAHPKSLSQSTTTSRSRQLSATGRCHCPTRTFINGPGAQLCTHAVLAANVNLPTGSGKPRAMYGGRIACSEMRRSCSRMVPIAVPGLLAIFTAKRGDAARGSNGSNTARLPLS
jgi:hypothetical protein